MDPRSLRLTNRLNNEEEQILNIDSRVIADRQNIRRLDNEMARQEEYTERQELINHNSDRNHRVNVAIFILLGVLIIVIAVIAGLAFERSHNSRFDENSINAHELDNNDDYTMQSLNLTSGSTGALSLETGGITFGSSQITADEFRVIDGAMAGTVIANKAVVVDSDRNAHGFGYITVGGASFSDGTCFKSLITAEAGVSVMSGSSFGALTKFHDGICVLGGVSFASTVDFYDGMSVGGTLYSYGGMSVSGTTDFSNLVTVESNTGLSVQGGISMSGLINMYSELQSTEGICILGGVSASGYTQLWGSTRIAEYSNINTQDLTAEGLSRGYEISKNDSGKEFFIDYANKDHMQFVLPQLDSSDTGHNYKFIWTEGPSVGDKLPFELIAGGRNDTMSGLVFRREKTTDDVDVISSNSVDVVNAKHRFDLTSMVLDGSVLNVKSYKGRWVIDGDIGVSPTPDAIDLFQDHTYKRWIATGTSYANSTRNVRTSILFSDNGQNWHTQYHMPEDLKTGGTYLPGVAFGNNNDGTSLYVAVAAGTANNIRNIIYSESGTSWQFATGVSFVDTTYNLCGQHVAYGMSSNGDHMWVAAGVADTATNRLIFSSGSNAGTCWMNSHSSGDTFGWSGNAIAFGQDGSGTCLWVAGGQDSGNLPETTNANKNIMYSTDGMSWTRSSSSGASFDNACYSVGYGTDHLGNRIWVAGGQDSDAERRLLWSTDGSCWAQMNTSGITPNSYINTVAYGTSPGSGVSLWMAGSYADASGSILYSTDGMSWSRAESNIESLTSIKVNTIAYGTSSNGDKMWVAAIDGFENPNHNKLLYSTDGVANWRESKNGAAEAGNVGLAFSRPLYPNSDNLIDDIYT